MPKLGTGWGVHYEKFHRVAQAWAIVGVAAAVRRSNGSIAEARIGLTNMGATPVRARATEAGAGRRRGRCRGHPGRGGQGGRGHRAAERPERQGRLPDRTWRRC